MKQIDLYKHLNRLTSTSSIVILFFLAHFVLLVMITYTFPRINAQIGTQAFDIKTFGYSIEEATALLENLDEATINFYIFPQLLLLDILYPFLLALFLSTLIIRLSTLTSIKRSSIYSNLFILPFIAMLSDYLENILILRMISNSAEISIGLIQTASFLTQTKGAFTSVSWLVILILFMIWLKNKWTN